MITLKNLSGTAAPVTAAVPAVGKIVVNPQRAGTGYRQIHHSRNVIDFTSSNGGHVQIAISELWKLVEQSDPLLCPPKPVDAPPKTP